MNLRNLVYILHITVLPPEKGGMGARISAKNQKRFAEVTLLIPSIGELIGELIGKKL